MQTPAMLTIKSSHIYRDTAAFIDTEGWIWVLGSNTCMYLGVKSPIGMTKPVRTSIRLNEGETIVQIYACLRLFAIYTSFKCLHISRVMKPSMFSNFEDVFDDNEGVYKGTEGCNEQSYNWLEESGLNRTKLRSVAFASEPGFVEPLTGIDNVAFWEDTCMFQQGPSHNLFNWRLCLRDAIGVCSALKLRPILHDQTLVYYKLRLPFSPDTVTYGNQFVHMQVGSRHHVLSAPDYHQVGDDGAITVNLLSWRDFEMDGLRSEHIYASLVERFAVMKDGVLYGYDDITGSLKPKACEPGARPIILNQHGADHPWLGFGEMDGTLTDVDGQPFYGPTPLIDSVIGIGCTMPVIDSDSHAPYVEEEDIDGLIINVHGLEWYYIVPQGIMTFDKVRGLRYYTNKWITAPPQMRLAEIIRNSADTIYSIGARLSDLEPITEAKVSYRMVVYQTASGQYFRYTFTDDRIEHRALVFDHMEETEIDYESIEYLAPSDDMLQPKIVIGPNDDSLERLRSVASWIGSYPCVVRVEHVLNGTIEAHGNGLQRDLAHKALILFANKFLLHRTGYTEFNFRALRTVPESILVDYGRMIHLAIVMLESHMPIRMPLAFLVAVMGREPTVAELERMISQTQPELFEEICALRDDPVGLADAGYDTYRDLLQGMMGYGISCVSTNEIDAMTDTNEAIREISAAMARGFGSYVLPRNLISMNTATLDCYLSGDFVINRAQFIRQLTFPQIDTEEPPPQPIPTCILKGCKELKKHISTLIRTGTEKQLEDLLKNWTGTTVLCDDDYTLVVRTDIDGIRFHTCFSAIDVPLCMIEGLIEDLYSDLTRPIDYISDRHAVIRDDADNGSDSDRDSPVELPTIQNLLDIDQHMIQAHQGSIRSIMEEDGILSDTEQDSLLSDTEQDD